jgi:hypothetical protein
VSEQIDNFCNDLRINLTMIEDKLQALKAKAVGKADEAERAVRQQMDMIQKKIEESRSSVNAAEAKVDEWAREQKAAAQSKIAEWKAKGDAKSLQARADLADAYAKAMSTIASSAVDEAAKAALEALLAHYDVEASKLTRGGG